MSDTAGEIHQCISKWGWVAIIEFPADMAEGMAPNEWKGTGHYLRFANFMDQDYDTYRIYYCPICGEKLDA